MTSIYDIPYEDIEKFLLANNKTFTNENDAYNIASILLKDKKAKGHTINIIEWMIAHNLLIRKINIPNYSIHEINKMSQNDINQLAKLLTMNGNNIVNIKNILYYLHKLDDLELVSDLKIRILQNLEELEINDINFETLTFGNVMNLLKRHRNKALIRKQIYSNMESIIFYNLLNINFGKLDNIEYIQSILEKIPSYIILEFIKNNKKRFLKHYTNEEINILIDFLEEIEIPEYLLLKNMNTLGIFLLDLIKIDEIGLAKKVFDIANKYNFRAIIINNNQSFTEYLFGILNYQKDNIVVFNKLLSFIGDDNFITNFNIIINRSDIYYIEGLLNTLVKLEKYDLLIKILDLFILKDFKGNGQIINMILPYIKKAIQLKNNNRVENYINIIKDLPQFYLNIKFNPDRLSHINNLIKTIERDKFWII